MTENHDRLPDPIAAGERVKRVLVIDDDRDIRETLTEALEFNGYAVISAADGAEALQKLRQGPLPCVILLDLMMPVMDGFQFRREQRLDPNLAGIPVVVTTAGGRADPRDIEADGYITKPLKLPKLLAALQRHCRAIDESRLPP